VTAGIPAATANTLIDTVTGAAGGGFIQFHIGDPGAAGTSNVGGDTTRPAIAFPAASAGSASQTGSATRSGWTGGSQTITHYSLWSAASAGTFRGSGAFSASRAVVNGDNLTVSGMQVTCGPIAA
jgi:hypothetical protein